MFWILLLAVVSCFAEEELVTTKHLITVNGAPLSYTAVAGTFIINDSEHQPAGKIFYVSYTRDDDFSYDRPVAFIFNGGPGTASLWLHLGAFGPKKAAAWDPNYRCVPPYHLEDNQQTLLDVMDLVFIDPIGTGFSAALPDQDAEQFYGLYEDAASVGDFICRYVTQFSRWLSPKYIIGESYGGLRAICLAQYLQDHHNLYVNGLSLISPVVSLKEYCDGSNSDHLSYALLLPTMAATAWYHHCLSEEMQNKSLQQVVQEASLYALNGYSLALMQGDSLAEIDRERVVQNILQLTGISSEVIEKENLRLNEELFVTQLLPRDPQTDLDPAVGIHDARITGYSAMRENPSDIIQGVYGALMNHYVRADLGYSAHEPYAVFNQDTNSQWRWDAAGNSDPRMVDLSQNIRHLFMVNPQLKIQVHCGYYDFATPFSATKYSFDHLHLPRCYRQNVQFHFYEAGHMMYLNPEAHEQLTDNIKSFFLN